MSAATKPQRPTYSFRHLIYGLHHFDRFLDMLRDMLSGQPLSCRKLAAQLQVSEDTVWRWRLRALEHLSGGPDQTFAGIIEAAETFQRESRKGSREWTHMLSGEQSQEPPLLRSAAPNQHSFQTSPFFDAWPIVLM